MNFLDTLLNKIKENSPFKCNPFSAINKKELEIQARLAQIIISSTDPEELKNKIVKETATVLEAYRCFLAEYDLSKNNFKKITNAYNAQRDALSLINFDIEANHPSLALKQKYMDSLLIGDCEKFIAENHLEGTSSEEYFKKYNIKASISVRLEFGDTFLGVIIVHYDRKKKHLKEFDLKFLKNLAEHISIALHLSKLYSAEKQEKERERLLRLVVSTMSQDYDLELVSGKVFEILEKIYDVKSLSLETNIKDFENFYLFEQGNNDLDEKKAASQSIFNKIYDSQELAIIKNQTHYIPDTTNFVIQNNLEGSFIDDFFTENGVLSAVIMPTKYEKQNLGVLILHFSKTNPLNKDDLDFISTIKEQLAIAIKQAWDYEKEKLNTIREMTISAITNKMRSSLDLDETLNFICNEIVKYFKIQRVSISIYEDVEDSTEMYVKKEYKISPDIDGISKMENFKKTSIYWRSVILKSSEVMAYESIEDANVPDYIKSDFRKIGVRAIMGVAIEKNGSVWGTVVLSEYNGTRAWSEDEKELLKLISNQIYIAIKQAELYTNVKKNAEREALVRKISEKIRSSLNLEETFTFICEETSKLFNVQRATIVKFYDMEDYENYEIKKEYKTNPALKGLSSTEYTKQAAAYWSKNLIEKNDIFFINEIETSDAPDYFKKCYNSLGVKAMIGSPIKKENVFWGTIVLSDYQNPRHWSQEEKELLQSIATQTYIAINQAELFEKEKLAAERERISRNIIEILRSTMDKNIIKRLFVRNIGKFFNADRVFISEYDPIKKMYMPVDENSEYLSGIDVKSFIGYDWSGKDSIEYIQPILDKREFKIFDWFEYKQNNPAHTDEFISLFEDSSTLSSYNFPIFYQDKIIGFFCIEFTSRVAKLSEEDVNRIRSICTQAGIALYHADLYADAQKAILSKEIFISEVSEKIKPPVKSILEQSIFLSQNEVERNYQIESLHNIINSCNELLELTRNLSAG